MDASAWVALVGAAVTAVAAGLTWWQARTARAALTETKRARQIASDQAHSARESATAASKSADAAMDQAKSAREALDIGRAQLDQADRPTVTVTLDRPRQGTGQAKVILLRDESSGPARIQVTADWTCEHVPAQPGGRNEPIEPTLEHGRHVVELVAKERAEFYVPTGANPDQVKVKVAMECVDTDTPTRLWQLAEAATWKRPKVFVGG